MPTRWIMVCESDAQPTFVAGTGQPNWSCASNQVLLPVDTVIAESSPWLAHTASGELPPASDAAAIWTAGFSLVLVCFVIGRSVGAVLDFFRKG